MNTPVTADTQNQETKRDPAPRHLIGVRVFGSSDHSEMFDPGTIKLRVGMAVIVKTQNGERYGLVASNKIANCRKDLRLPIPRVLRVATADDLAAQKRKEETEGRAHNVCLEKIAKLQLPMNLSRVVQLPEQTKLVFYFTAEGRVDFRELVRDLAQTLRSKIEMRQVGVRDEARAITGYGMCGLSLCCATFLGDFSPVTVRMAKDQGLALNPSKISGVCGRLMCCLQYEHEVYRGLVKHMPKLNGRIQAPEGPGKVIKNDILLQRVTVRLDDESIITYHIDELKSGVRREAPGAPPAGNGNSAE